MCFLLKSHKKGLDVIKQRSFQEFWNIMCVTIMVELILSVSSFPYLPSLRPPPAGPGTKRMSADDRRSGRKNRSACCRLIFYILMICTRHLKQWYQYYSSILSFCKKKNTLQEKYKKDQEKLEEVWKKAQKDSALSSKNEKVCTILLLLYISR